VSCAGGVEIHGGHKDFVGHCRPKRLKERGFAGMPEKKQMTKTAFNLLDADQ